MCAVFRCVLVCCVCSCCAVCLEVRALCAAVHVGACAPAVLCAGTCAAGACLCAAVCRCVLCERCVCCCVCMCVHVQCVCSCVCRCVLVCSCCADTGVCACFRSICSHIRVCVCAVCLYRDTCMRARSILSWREAHHNTHSRGCKPHTQAHYPRTLLPSIHSRCISIHAGERGRSLHPCRLAYLERGEGTWTTVCSTADGCILSNRSGPSRASALADK